MHEQKAPLYDLAYYQKINSEEKVQAERLAEILIQKYEPQFVIDVGCATGLYLAPFLKVGIQVEGYDTSTILETALQIPQNLIKNLNFIQQGLPQADLCLCLETLEHIEEKDAEQAIKNIATSANTIIFSAAPPGQGGVGHINCQPKEYWEALFVDKGLTRNIEAEDHIKFIMCSGYHMGWLVQNLMVFQNQKVELPDKCGKCGKSNLISSKTRLGLPVCRYCQNLLTGKYKMEESFTWVDPRWKTHPGCIIDIGCLGWDWSTQFLGLRTVIGIDPHEPHCPENAILLRKAITFSDGTAKMGTSNGQDNSLLFHQTKQDLVETLSFQTLLKQYPNPAIIKMNVEGSEYPLLMSVKHPIADQLIVSFHDTEWLSSSIYDLNATTALLNYLNAWYTITCIHTSCKWFLFRNRKSVEIQLSETPEDKSLRNYLEIGQISLNKFKDRKGWGTSLVKPDCLDYAHLKHRKIDLLELNAENYNLPILENFLNLGLYPTHIIFETQYITDTQFDQLDEHLRKLNYSFRGRLKNRVQYSKSSVLIVTDIGWALGTLAKDIIFLSSWSVDLLDWSKSINYLKKKFAEYDSVISHGLFSLYVWPELQNHGSICSSTPEATAELNKNRDLICKCLGAISKDVYPVLFKFQRKGTLHLTTCSARLSRFNRKKPRSLKTLGWCGLLNANPQYEPIKRSSMFIEISNTMKMDFKISKSDYTYETMQTFYDSIDLLICTSTSEATPLPIFEAIACGVPVISTNVGLTKEVDTIWKFNTTLEACELIEKLLLFSLEELEDYQDKQYEQFKKGFCMEKFIPQWDEFFKACAQKGPCFL